MRRTVLVVLFALGTAAALVSCGGGGSSSPSAQAPPTNGAAPTPGPSSTATTSNGITISGNATFSALGQTSQLIVSEAGGTSSTYFVASENTACNGVATVTVASAPSNAPSGTLAGTAFNVVANQNSTSCILTFTSSDNGSAASVTLIVGAPSATASPIPVQ
jgi:hypothetical protein